MEYTFLSVIAVLGRVALAFLWTLLVMLLVPIITRQLKIRRDKKTDKKEKEDQDDRL